ncbi:MAG: hypothetical protein QXZ10_04310 [Sulfolobales archaeon]
MGGFTTGGRPPRYLYFDAKDMTSVNRSNINFKPYTLRDTAAASVVSTTRVNIKTYNYDTAGGATPRKVRVRVWGHTDASGTTAYFILVIDGADVASTSTSSTSSILVIDYVADISPGPHTIAIDGYNSHSGIRTYVDSVTIIDSFTVTSTTPTSLGSFSFNPANEHILKCFGDFKFEVGNRLKVGIYKKITSNATVTINNTNYTLASGDDEDEYRLGLFLTFPLSTTSFTITANVTTAGDILWILGIFVQVTLRGNQVDKYNTSPHHIVLINERGLFAFSIRYKTICEKGLKMTVRVITLNGFREEYYSSSGGDVMVYSPVFSNAEQKALYVDYSRDDYSHAVTLYLHLAVVS